MKYYVKGLVLQNEWRDLFHYLRFNVVAGVCYSKLVRRLNILLLVLLKI